jgi:predicted protein tyrosine phosphatase
MDRTTRVLIVGSDHLPDACARLLAERFATKHVHIDRLTTPDIHWSEMILVTHNDHRRLIAHRFPSEYLLRRVVNLEITDTPEHPESAIRAQLENHGLLSRSL